MRKALAVYAVSGALFLALYGVGGFTGWWRGIIRWTGSSAYGGRGSGGGSSGWSGGGGGFRGGK